MRLTSHQVFFSLAAVLLATGVWGSVAMSGCTQVQGKVPERLTIFYSNETANELYRCGCKSKQLGGLSRRATVIATKEDAPELLVDAGNFAGSRPGNPYDELKLSTLLQTYDLMGYSALNVGPVEFNRGKSGLEELAERTGKRMISANVVDEAGTLVLPPYTIAEIDGLKVGIVGLITEQFRPNAENPADTLMTTEPIAAMNTIWKELKAASDIQVVLSQLRDDENTQLIKAFPGIDAIIGGPGWRVYQEMKPRDENGIAIAKVGDRGKYFGELTLELDSTDRRNVRVAEFDGAVTELDDQVPDNPAVEQVLEAFKEKVRSGEVVPDIYEAGMEDAQHEYGSAIYCQTCHGEIYAGWLRTRHAQALQTLAKEGEQNNPGCLECHTVGYDEPGGYLAKDRTYLMANVQCENCHGPAGEHMQVAADYRDGAISQPTDWKVKSTNTPESTCVTCHTADNDPHWQGDIWPYAQMVEEIGCSQWLHPASPQQ